MTDIIIRPALSSDFDSIQRIYAVEVAKGTASFELEPPTKAEMIKRWQILETQSFPYLVAVNKGVILGYAYAGPYHRRPGYRFSLESSVYVNRTAQRQGVGSALLSRLIHICRDQGHRQLVAIIGDSANIASIELHHKAGFRLVGTLENVGHKFDRWLDSVIMQKDLSGIHEK